MKVALLLASLLLGLGIWALSSSIGNHEGITLFGSTVDPRYVRVAGVFCAVGGVLTILSSLRDLQLKSG